MLVLHFPAGTFGLLLVLGLAACGGTRLPVAPPGTPPEPSPARLGVASVAFRKAATDSVRAAFAGVRLREAGLTPVAGADFSGVGAALAFLPGGVPGARDSLVVAAASWEAGPALLEAARLLAERSRYTAQPGRTVLFALGPPDERGLASALTRAVWRPEQVVRLLLVAPEPGLVRAADAFAAGSGIPVEVVPTDTSDVALARATYAAIRAVARADLISLPDTVLASTLPR